MHKVEPFLEKVRIRLVCLMVIARQNCVPISVRKYYVLDDNGSQELAMEYDIKL